MSSTVAEQTRSKASLYRNGGEGFILWVEDNCRLPVYPPGSDIPIWMYINQFSPGYKKIWEEQKDVVREALSMVGGRFIYNLIILCWMRGEGKSLLACLIEIWKFFCWPRQNITLGANSKEQTKFVHYDIMRDIIVNSPKLLARVGRRNVQEKEIRLKDREGNVVSTIKAISSFSGIVSNITGFTFSEIFDMKNPKFFTQLYGSIRNIPNALGVIDSTVSEKSHILYALYEGFVTHKTKRVFFHYRCSQEGKAYDFWNPQMSDDQLDDYRATFLPNDFDRYFRNVWSAGGQRVFTDAMIEACKYIGLDGRANCQREVMELIDTRIKIKENYDKMVERGTSVIDTRGVQNNLLQIDRLQTRLWPVTDFYNLEREARLDQVARTGIAMGTVQDLDRLGDFYDTDWAILVGGDRADPMKEGSGAKTILSLIAKGLPASRSNPLATVTAANHYIYFLLGLWALGKHTLEELKTILIEINGEFDGIDKLCVEKWGMWDLEGWCIEQSIDFEAVHPSYDKQRACFTEFFILVRDGRFKRPPVPVGGVKQNDIITEEMEVFDHDATKRWFGSPEKKDRHGVQDDSMYATGWGIYGGRELNVDSFRQRKGKVNFGEMFQNKDLVAIW